jgi:hypothetical protein
MDPIEESLNGYPGRSDGYVDEEERRSRGWILSIDRACDKFLESRGLKRTIPASTLPLAIERTGEKERRRFQHRRVRRSKRRKGL